MDLRNTQIVCPELQQSGMEKYCLLPSSHHAKCFVCIISFNPYTSQSLLWISSTLTWLSLHGSSQTNIFRSFHMLILLPGMLFLDRCLSSSILTSFMYLVIVTFLRHCMQQHFWPHSTHYSFTPFNFIYLFIIYLLIFFFG